MSPPSGPRWRRFVKKHVFTDLDFDLFGLFVFQALFVDVLIFFSTKGTGSSDLQMKKARWNKRQWRLSVGEHESVWYPYHLFSTAHSHLLTTHSSFSGLAQTRPFTPVWGWPASVTRVLSRSWVAAPKKLVSVPLLTWRLLYSNAGYVISYSEIDVT